MVRVPGLVALFPANMIAPELVTVPTVTAPLILPVLPSMPALTCTAPLPVPEPVLFFTKRLPALTVVAASVGIRIGQTQFAVPHFCKRTARAAADSAIPDQPGKGRAKVVRADGQVIRPEKDQTISFDRAGRHARSALLSYIKVAVAVNLHARCVVSRSGRKTNQTC